MESNDFLQQKATAGLEVQWLRALAALPEDPGSVPWFSFQHPHGSQQPSITPDPGDLMCSVLLASVGTRHGLGAHINT